MKAFVPLIYILIGLGTSAGFPDTLCGKAIGIEIKITAAILWPMIIGARLADAHGDASLGYNPVCQPAVGG